MMNSWDFRHFYGEFKLIPLSFLGYTINFLGEPPNPSPGGVGSTLRLCRHGFGGGTHPGLAACRGHRVSRVSLNGLPGKQT